jgi:hypothetical protein
MIVMDFLALKVDDFAYFERLTVSMKILWRKFLLAPSQRRLEARPGMHCNSLILSISRDAASLFDYSSRCVHYSIIQGAVSLIFN